MIQLDRAWLLMRFRVGPTNRTVPYFCDVGIYSEPFPTPRESSEFYACLLVERGATYAAAAQAVLARCNEWPSLHWTLPYLKPYPVSR